MINKEKCKKLVDELYAKYHKIVHKVVGVSVNTSYDAVLSSNDYSQHVWCYITKLARRPKGYDLLKHHPNVSRLLARLTRRRCIDLLRAVSLTRDGKKRVPNTIPITDNYSDYIDSNMHDYGKYNDIDDTISLDISPEAIQHCHHRDKIKELMKALIYPPKQILDKHFSTNMIIHSGRCTYYRKQKRITWEDNNHRIYLDGCIHENKSVSSSSGHIRVEPLEYAKDWKYSADTGLTSRRKGILLSFDRKRGFVLEIMISKYPNKQGEYEGWYYQRSINPSIGAYTMRKDITKYVGLPEYEYRLLHISMHNHIHGTRIKTNSDYYDKSVDSKKESVYTS